MNHIFKKTLTLETRLFPEEIQYTLLENDEYEGEKHIFDFNIMRMADTQHTYFPRITGQVSECGGNTRIDIQMKLDKLHAISLAITYIGISILIIGAFRLFELNDLIFVNIEWIWLPMAIVGFVKQIVLKFRDECKNSKEDLLRILLAREI